MDTTRSHIPPFTSHIGAPYLRLAACTPLGLAAQPQSGQWAYAHGLVAYSHNGAGAVIAGLRLHMPCGRRGRHARGARLAALACGRRGCVRAGNPRAADSCHPAPLAGVGGGGPWMPAPGGCGVHM